jgi:leucine efflux protein
VVFLALKCAGGAYLAYLGINMLVAAWRGGAPARSTEDSAYAIQQSVGDPLRRALGISLLNPKAILFCLAFFIEFVDPAYEHKALSFAILWFIAQCFSFLYLSVLIFSGARLAVYFRRRHRTRAALTGVAGTAFVGFGVKLASASLSG